MQEGEADEEVLTVTKNQPVELVRPRVLPGQRLLKCTLPILVSQKDASHVSTHGHLHIHMPALLIMHHIGKLALH